jgi:phosphoribosyl 1,2-cyclic phosphodiesterase
MNDNFSIKFWGVRGSHPSPGPQTVYYGGNTACVEVRAAGQTIILDAGTGIIPLGREIARRFTREHETAQPVLLFSHLHHDHTQGFPFFAPAYNPAMHLHLFGPGTSKASLQKILSANQSPPGFPITLREMGAIKNIHSLRETELINFETGIPALGKPGQSGGLMIRMMKSYAHPGGVFVYRIEWRGMSLVYATDIEGYVGSDQRLAAFAKGADLLIHDAQYSQPDYASRQGFGHSTAKMACELAHAAGVKRLALFHHDPTYDDEMIQDMQEQSQTDFKNSFAARESQVLELSNEINPGTRAEKHVRDQTTQSGLVQKAA